MNDYPRNFKNIFFLPCLIATPNHLYGDSSSFGDCYSNWNRPSEPYQKNYYIICNLNFYSKQYKSVVSIYVSPTFKFFKPEFLMNYSQTLFCVVS